ncbi:MAG: aldehyde ferredoxin oxidoreductase [Candidatus Lokiarchaeota archaeon]|nr:aldehyde ferredoxin oxidoreductase [Candidatus Lokiarchaeota archaeon]MBD3199590.1 aldehyde ferredoxin oxidoreductase [Candidatus Lokiarchaeota archaeon]
MLEVDLSSGEITDIKLNEEIAESFLGATGYSVRYLYDFIDEDTDPLGPDNILMFMTGPLCGSTVPTSGRFAVSAKSPYTGIWGEANCGGYFGPELKKTGYDGIIIKGKSDNPVYLNITEDNVDLMDATHLWGKGTLETHDILKKELGSNMVRVACIGPAGEKQVKFATIASEEKAAGRTGMGAVMGSKNLKAITVRGKKRKYEAAKPEEFKEAVKNMLENVNNSFTTQMFGMLGTPGGVDKYNMEGELPIKYWTKGEWEGAFNISGATASEKIYTKQYPCYSCPIGCAHKASVSEGKYATEGEVESPEYETIVSFGSLILNDDLNSIVKANTLCNDYGIDTISGGSAIALVYYLYNNGKISSDDIDGLKPEWGEIEPALEMIKKIANREGIGDILADGSNAVGEEFGISQDEIATSIGQEVPYHDLRHTWGMALAYSVGTTRGPCHCACDMYMVLLGLPFQDLGIELIDRQSDDGKKTAKNCAIAYDYRALYNSLVLCIFSNPPPDMVADVIETATGLNFDIERIKKTGERIYTMKRLFNLKMGLTPKDERLPQILLKPLEDGGSAGKTPDFDKLKDFYFKVRDWDAETGYPSQEILKELGLENI